MEQDPSFSMKTKRSILLSIAFIFMTCIRMGPGHSSENEDGPYIDSLGFRASLARVDNVVDQSTGTLIKQALEVQENTTGNTDQPDFFQSLEDDYQRYLKIFKLSRTGRLTEATSDYNLLETFRAKVFDPQPFMNALLHTMKLREITTLDYIIQADKTDTMLVQVSWAKPTALEAGKGFGITEGTLALLVSRHSVSVAGPLPEALQKKK
jgi:hypothetical protein